MFKKLVKRLFKSTKTKKAANYAYFEVSRNTKINEQEKSVEQLQQALSLPPLAITTAEEKFQKAFYDFLFGQANQDSLAPQEDELTLHITEQVEKLLKSPAHLLKSLPVLPVSLAKILEQLNNNAFNTGELIELIQQEAVIAAKVIELANSSFYNRSNKEITDLKSAFMLLGANGLMEGVINGFVSALAPQQQIYFKQYGHKIWSHSLATGILSKKLIAKSEHKKDTAQGYLIGLVCNLGDMIIYQLLVDAFSHVHPDCQPDSNAFKILMAKNSKRITYHIAKYWNFPRAILDTLALQEKIKKSSLLPKVYEQYPIACYVYEANIISQLTLRLDNNEIEQGSENEVINHVISKLVYSEQAKTKLEKLIIAENHVEHSA